MYFLSEMGFISFLDNVNLQYKKVNFSNKSLGLIILNIYMKQWVLILSMTHFFFFSMIMKVWSLANRLNWIPAHSLDIIFA